MNSCPILLIANKSLNPSGKINKEEINCAGHSCSWFNNQEESCALIESIDKKNYIIKSFNFI